MTSTPLDLSITDEIWRAIGEAVRTTKTLPEGLEIGPDTRIKEDLAIKSHELLNIVFMIEEHFDINLLIAMTNDLATLGEAHDLIATLVAPPAAPAP